MSTGKWEIAHLQDFIDRNEARRLELIKQEEAHWAHLPLKFLQQQAHFTTPASNFDMVKKAVEKGYGALPKILEKFGISLSELADTLGVTVKDIESLLNADLKAPLVMVDGEDAQALREDVVERGRENSIRVFREADWGHTLRFYRPSGMRLEYCVRDLAIVLSEAGKGCDAGKFPIDGVIWPKTEQPEQLNWVMDMLGELEHHLGLKENQIKLEFLVESGWAAVNLPELIKVTLPRLAGIIWGIADYSADVGLPDIINGHPVCDWVREEIVNLSGAIGVPSIDNMTVNYPVADASLDNAANKKRILERLKECYDDALHGAELGMSGKWVGHPAQLFCVLLAYRTALPASVVHQEVEKIREYTKAVEQELGATIIKGVMSDRATDRHARNKLRTAIAIGHLDAATGLEIGLITEEEAKSLQ